MGRTNFICVVNINVRQMIHTKMFTYFIGKKKKKKKKKEFRKSTATFVTSILDRPGCNVSSCREQRPHSMIWFHSVHISEGTFSLLCGSDVIVMTDNENDCLNCWLMRHFHTIIVRGSVGAILICLFVLRFYGPVNPMGSWRARSVYLTTRLLGRLSPLSG